MATQLRIDVREVVPSDLPVHFEQQRDEASWRMAAVRPRDRAAFDAHWAKTLADPTAVLRTIVADDAIAGHVCSFVIDGERQVGYWVAREQWGNGIATAALEQLLEEVAERPLYARVAAHNPGSRRVLEKCGFTLVGEEADDDVRVGVLRLD